MTGEGFIYATLGLPLLAAAAAWRVRSPGVLLALCAGGTWLTAIAGWIGVGWVFTRGTILAAGQWLMLDPLSAYHLAVMMGVFAYAGVYSVFYFVAERRGERISVRELRRYVMLWFGALSAMALALMSNNIGVLWVGIEATTLLTAFLICTHSSPAALEAMWKYLLMCSVGVAVAFMGTLLVAASAAPAHMGGADTMLWTRLMAEAPRLTPGLLKAGFIFMVIGYGTKAGLAPMHNWLPDAHSQAPAPVSAVFSGFLLNAGLYAVLRCLPLAEAATGHTGWAREILMAFGLLSIVVAAIFFVTQHDLKRLLAYSSVEHIGILALGMGLGGGGAVAALFHLFNHSLCKTALFCCAGGLGQVCGTYDIRRMDGAARVSVTWGVGLAGGLLALTGAAPFALFLSEFLILKAAIDARAYATAALFLAGLVIVFVGALRVVMAVLWKRPAPDVKPVAFCPGEASLAFVPLVILLVLGLWVPEPFWNALTAAARILEGAP